MTAGGKAGMAHTDDLTSSIQSRHLAPSQLLRLWQEGFERLASLSDLIHISKINTF